MKKVIFGGLLLAAVLLVSTAMLATADVNGPYIINEPGPGHANCGYNWIDPPGNACIIGLHGTWEECCVWAYNRASYCGSQQGENCYTQDHKQGTCCYQFF